jgi:hypothetical protein
MFSTSLSNIYLIFKKRLDNSNFNFLELQKLRKKYAKYTIVVYL